MRTNHAVNVRADQGWFLRNILHFLPTTGVAGGGKMSLFQQLLFQEIPDQSFLRSCQVDDESVPCFTSLFVASPRNFSGNAGIRLEYSMWSSRRRFSLARYLYFGNVYHDIRQSFYRYIFSFVHSEFLQKRNILIFNFPIFFISFFSYTREFYYGQEQVCKIK